jgi:hypothetical protein
MSSKRPTCFNCRTEYVASCSRAYCLRCLESGRELRPIPVLRSLWWDMEDLIASTLDWCPFGD